MPRLPGVCWQRADGQAIETLYGWAEDVVCDIIQWYLDEKRRKAAWSRGLRTVAVVLVTVGGAVPVVALTSGHPALGNWGYVLLALAGGCLAYDRGFGYSSTWQRHMATAISLRAQVTDFQLAWARELAGHDHRSLTPERTVELVSLTHTFLAGVNQTIRQETDTWLTEFAGRLAELEARLALASAPPNGVTPSGVPLTPARQ